MSQTPKWFDENDEGIKNLLKGKQCLHNAHQNDTSAISKKAAYSNICKTDQNRLRDMHDSWLSMKAEHILFLQHRKGIKKFNDTLKRILKPPHC